MSKKLGLPEQDIDLERNSLEDNELNSALKTEEKTSIVSASPDNLKNGELADTEGKIWAIGALSAALLAVSLAAIFIRLSEREISPNATVFNRLWIATVVFGLWNGAGAARRRMSGAQVEGRSNYTWPDVMLLTAVGVVSSASLGFWAWSLTQTNVANSTVLRNLTPLFTTLGGWLLLGGALTTGFWWDWRWLCPAQLRSEWTICKLRETILPATLLLFYRRCFMQEIC